MFTHNLNELMTLTLNRVIEASNQFKLIGYFLNEKKTQNVLFNFNLRQINSKNQHIDDQVSVKFHGILMYS